VFERTEHDRVLAQIAALNIQPLPLIVPTTHKKWLGQN
jgi:hypothetical protein